MYGLFEENWEPTETSVRAFSEALANKLSSRAAERRQTGRLRMSMLGETCDRRLWFRVNAPEKAEKLPGATRIKFLFGDILEEMLLYLAKEAGHKVEREQEEVSIAGVSGHIDAIVDGELLDVKSSSTYGMEKFRNNALREDDPFGYLGQLGAYGYALGGVSRNFLAVDKTLGHLHVDSYEPSKEDYEKLISEKKEIVSKKTPPTTLIPDEPMGKSGNRALSTKCSYCEFKAECRPFRTFLYSNGPAFLTEVHLLPKVQEVR